MQCLHLRTALQWSLKTVLKLKVNPGVYERNDYVGKRCKIVVSWLTIHEYLGSSELIPHFIIDCINCNSFSEGSWTLIICPFGRCQSSITQTGAEAMPND
jgi:hypothetical protein